MRWFVAGAARLARSASDTLKLMSLDLIRIPRMFAVVLVLVGLGFVMVGLVRQEVSCSRAAGSCTIVEGAPFLKSTHVLELGDIHGHEYRRLPRSFGDWGATVLLIRWDIEARVAPGPEAEARRNHDALVGFVRGEGETLTLESPPALPIVILGVLLIVAAPLPYWVFYKLGGGAVASTHAGEDEET